MVTQPTSLAIERLKSSSALALYKKYTVKKLSLFGSYARGEQTDSSDIDLLIDFESDGHIGIFQMMELQNELSNILGKRVEFTGAHGRKSNILLPFIQSDLTPIYG